MQNTIIKIQNLSKQYRLGLVGTGTLSHDLKRWWTVNIRGKEDPYLKIGDVNVRSGKAESDYVWALKDINLEIEQGDVVGIIGKNGAGKSTLLKILSRVTKPTVGSIEYRGRIASLLEVGTGFHPEMTGRENIYMNGAIMGMTRHEITRKLDEIIAFAGVERYIDTPVKRYSSGMTVRLGFSIAAHLEPDILVVDEVLAVGDAEFQKKAVGKMQDVSKGGGRTVLFVSHNMAAVEALCQKVILMTDGYIAKQGTPSTIISEYLDNFISEEFTNNLAQIKKREGSGLIQFSKIRLLNSENNKVKTLRSGERCTIDLELIVKTPNDYNNVHISVRIVDKNGSSIFHLSNSVAEGKEIQLKRDVRKLKVFFVIKKLPLNQGEFYIHLHCDSSNKVLDKINFSTKLIVEQGGYYKSGRLPAPHLATFLPDYKFEVQEVEET